MTKCNVIAQMNPESKRTLENRLQLKIMYQCWLTSSDKGTIQWKTFTIGENGWGVYKNSLYRIFYNSKTALK